MLKRYSFAHFVFELTRNFACLIFLISFIFILVNYSLLFANGFINDYIFISTFSVFTFLLIFILVIIVWLLIKLFKDNNINTLGFMNKIIFLFINYYFYLISSTIAIVVLNYLYTNKIEFEFMLSFIDGVLVISFFILYFHQKYKMIKNNTQNIMQIKIVKYNERLEKTKFYKNDVWSKNEMISENIEFNGFYNGRYYFVDVIKKESYSLVFDKSYVILCLLNKTELNQYIMKEIESLEKHITI